MGGKVPLVRYEYDRCLGSGSFARQSLARQSFARQPLGRKLFARQLITEKG